MARAVSQDDTRRSPWPSRAAAGRQAAAATRSAAGHRSGLYARRRCPMPRSQKQLRQSAQELCASEAAPVEAPRKLWLRVKLHLPKQRRKRSMLKRPLKPPRPKRPPTPELVEVWRPGGRSEERRPRHDRNRHQRHGHQAAAADGAAPAAPVKPAPVRSANTIVAGGVIATMNCASAAEGLRGSGRGTGRRGRAGDRGARAPEPQEQRHRGNRPPRERFEGKDRERDKAAVRKIRRRPQQGRSQQGS